MASFSLICEQPLHLFIVYCGSDSNSHGVQSKDNAIVADKTQLTSFSVLAHYNSKWELTLACDASPYGVGVVLPHVMDDDSEQPVTCISRSLSPAEQNYAQLDREALAIVFRVTKLRQYLLSCHFKIVSDHKPLI